MAFYLLQAAYTPQAWSEMQAHPDQAVCGVTVRPVAEKMGGRFHAGWVAFGEYDIVVVLEMPDDVSAAAVSMALSASGRLKAVKTTPLMTMDEGRAALRKSR